MTFRDIALKNFKTQLKKYMSYFLCSSFSIMIFFMYSTLRFNSDLSNREDFSMVTLIFNIAMVAVALFSIFFINYAHSAFIESRHKEFGIYMTLGMSQSDIRKIILLENLLIILSSLFAGLASGLIFSRFFQMIVLKLLDMDGIGYSLNYKCFAITLLVFAAIFTCVIVLGRLSTRNLDISDLLRKARKGNAASNPSITGGILGVFLIIFSFTLLGIITRNNTLKSNNAAIMSYFLISFAGIYITIASLGKTCIGILRKRKDLYYKNLLVATEIGHKFNQNKKIIFVLSILSSMIVFLVASPYSLLSLSKSIAEMSQPNHIEYAQIGEVNKISPDELKNILAKAGTEITSQKEIKFISLLMDGDVDKYDLLHSKPVISQSIYNAATAGTLEIPRGQAVNVITAWEPGYHGIRPSTSISLYRGDKHFRFLVKDSLHLKWVTGGAVYPSSSGIVLNDADYNEIYNKVSQEHMGIFHIFNFKNWEKTGSVFEDLKSTLTNVNQKSLLPAQADSKLFKVASRLDAYKGLKQGYSLFIFVTTAMGILFFIAAGSILYFKQYTELTGTKAKFFKLYKLGITENEASGIIAKELKLTFFTPLIFGSILGYSFIYFMTFWVGGERVIQDFMLNATVVVAGYFIFQVLFYLAAKRKYTAEILETL
ncbi:MAG: FtsX-like permease family protein [Clostridia bacterium]|nr:FtsX-like permease family protein [Clostridia bacterium]